MHFWRQPHVSGSSALAGGHGMGGQAWHSDAQESPEHGNHSHWTALQEPCKGTAKPSCPHGHKLPTCFSGGRCFWFISRRHITDSWGKVSHCPLTCDSAWRKWDVRMLLLWRCSHQQLLASRCLDSLVKLEMISMALIWKGKKMVIASTFTPFYSSCLLGWDLLLHYCTSPWWCPQFCQETLVALLDFTQLKMSLQSENQQFYRSDQKRKDGQLCS